MIQSFTSSGYRSMETVLNYFWLLAIIVNGINAIIFWIRAQVYIRKNSDLRPGYVRLVQGFFVGMTIPWIVMGIGLERGGVSSIGDYFYPRGGNPFVMAWWGSIWALILLLGYWIFFQGGAETLIKYPGFVRGKPTHPKTIKLMWLLLSISNGVASGIIWSVQPH